MTIPPSSLLLYDFSKRFQFREALNFIRQLIGPSRKISASNSNSIPSFDTSIAFSVRLFTNKIVSGSGTL